MRFVLTTLMAAGVGSVFNAAARGEVQVASIFGSEMVLQCDASVPVWGTANPREKVTVDFAGQSVSAVADAQGRWSMTLPAMAASDAVSNPLPDAFELSTASTAAQRQPNAIATAK